jgi:predicted DNA-binding protein with PD1-like motif
VPFADVSRQEDVATHLLSLRQGQEILSALLEFARDERLVSGSLKASGAVRNARIACWDPATHEYTQVHVREPAELSLIAGLGLADGQALLHAHAVLRLRDGSTRTGHLLQAHVRSNLKIRLAGWSRPLRRANEPESGLAPLCLAS